MLRKFRHSFRSTFSLIHYFKALSELLKCLLKTTLRLFKDYLKTIQCYFKTDYLKPAKSTTKIISKDNLKTIKLYSAWHYSTHVLFDILIGKRATLKRKVKLHLNQEMYLEHQKFLNTKYFM